LRYDRSFAVLMLDADNLKPVNDTYGHEAGSELITHVATVIREQLRSSDIIARFGGDEFVALLPETASESACIAAERIRGILAEYAMDFKNASITVTVSIGVAGFSEHGGSVKEVMNCADKALYFCKESGRNKIAVFDPACMQGSNAANA
ncbi:MAG: GGDEF domain-containing protein, partial [bacterium]|nr:GGDEF domain-containing protein [bacterium]